MRTHFQGMRRCSTVAALLLSCIISASAIAQQPGSINGRVYLGTGEETAPGVHVVVEGTGKGAVSGEDGSFLITDIAEGVYTLKASCIGYASEMKHEVLVRAGKPSTVSFRLADSPFLLNEVVVTGTLNKHLLKDTPVITEVISARDLASSGSADLADVMRSQTGIEISTGIGQTQSAQLHGLSDNHVLILVDGERLTGKVDGAVDLGQIPVNSIEKIEVVKGPLSAKYGTDAIGGVVNIITKDADRADRLRIAAAAGSNGRQEIELSAAQVLTRPFGAESSAKLFFNGGWKQYGGMDYSKTERDKFPALPAEDNFMEKPEYDRKNVGLKSSLRLNSAFVIDLRGEYYRDRSDWLAGNRSLYLRDGATNEKLTGTAAAEYQFTPTTSARISTHLSRNDHTSTEQSRSGFFVRDDASSEQVETYRAQFSSNPYGNSMLTLGYEHRVEAAESDRLSEIGRAYYNNIVYGEDEWTMGDLMLSVGGRWSDNSVYGSFFAPRASLLWKTTDNVTLRASYGRGFRAPSINELYIDFPNTGVGYIVEGEPSLQPETSTGYNLGLQYAREDLVWFRFNAYYNQLTNLIDYFVKGTEPIVLSYRNIDEAVTRGVDVDVDLNVLDDVTIGLGYAWTVAQDGNGADLPFRTPHSVTWRITHSWEWAGLRTHLRGRWFDRQLVTDEQINLSIYSGGGDAEFFYTPSHMILDLKFVRPMFEVFELSAGINNITRQIYYPFGQIKGREYFAGLTWTLR